MCLILIAYDSHPDYRLVVAANRDEQYARPTEALGAWTDGSGIIAGRDLEANGTWLGITPKGRFAAVTNFRSPTPRISNAPTRGHLVSGFLAGKEPPHEYLERIRSVGHRYNGFNLLVADMDVLLYYSNRGSGIQELAPGTYGVSTCLLGTEWPKITRGKEGVETLVSRESQICPEDLFHILADRAFPADEELPETVTDRDWERILAPIFISSEAYGTRSSTGVLVARSGRATITERAFVRRDGQPAVHETREFTFVLNP